MKKRTMVITLVLIALIVYGAVGWSESTDTADTAAAPAKPCEFQEGEQFCVSEAGDVYFDTLGYMQKVCGANRASETCTRLEEGTALKAICIDGPDFGMCTDETGKVDPIDVSEDMLQ